MQTGYAVELLTTLAVARWGDFLLEHFDDEIIHCVTSSYEVKVTGYHDTGHRR
jgi:hypothetical protein